MSPWITSPAFPDGWDPRRHRQGRLGVSGCIQHPSAHGFRERGEINKGKERSQFQGKEMISSSSDPGHHYANNREGTGIEAGKGLQGDRDVTCGVAQPGGRA